jgi:hypothetical protein
MTTPRDRTPDGKPRLARPVIVLTLLLAGLPGVLLAADPKPGPPLTIRRASGPITLDGDLSDPGWQGADAIMQWYETNVGDNVEPQVKNVAWLTYDDHYFYAGFQFEDPDPKAIRAPFGDHDGTPSTTDYAGVIIDGMNDGKTAQMFLANLNGTEYDAISNDATGEDSSPDFFWDAVGKRTATGWNLEIRIPLSSLRYHDGGDPSAPKTWGIMLYRNYPRDRRYQFFTNRLPRDVNCFICNSSKLTGFENLPRAGHLVVAPYATVEQNAAPRGDLGTPLVADKTKLDGGIDMKWNPSTALTVDATINPDFSQVESDTAQITANERFALFFPEKRPFFLEGIDLFATPIQAVYTRTVTDPAAGLRATGKVGDTAYTALIAQDNGGGQVVIPGAQSSELADQDFKSKVGIFRLRRDFGTSFASFLATSREIEGGGSNRVFGPDFVFRPSQSDAITGQLLLSNSVTPNRPDLASEWDGRSLSGEAWKLNWAHNTEHYDLFVQHQGVSSEFRADDGFVPQAGFDEAYFETGWTIRPKGFFNRVRFFTVDYYDRDANHDLLSRRVSVGAGMDGALNSFTRLEANSDDFLVGTKVLHRFRPRIYAEVRPGAVINDVYVDAYFGDEVDFDNAREGKGATILLFASIRPSEHLELRFTGSRRWLDVNAKEPSIDRSGRLFTAQVERLRGTYAFTSRAFVRLIGQYVSTTRDPGLYTFETTKKDADFTGSALFAYKLNWQTVLFVGYGDSSTFLDTTDRLEKSGRQIFVKISYAWQH